MATCAAQVAKATVMLPPCVAKSLRAALSSVEWICAAVLVRISHKILLSLSDWMVSDYFLSQEVGAVHRKPIASVQTSSPLARKASESAASSDQRLAARAPGPLEVEPSATTRPQTSETVSAIALRRRRSRPPAILIFISPLRQSILLRSPSFLHRPQTSHSCVSSPR